MIVGFQVARSVQSGDHFPQVDLSIPNESAYLQWEVRLRDGEDEGGDGVPNPSVRC
jgi:hypothetical protein